MNNTISFKSKYGWISAYEKNGKITEVKFLKSKNVGSSLILIKLKKLINAYFSKKITSFNIPLFLNGSDLQKNIWKELKKIEYGETKSYGEIAKIVKTSPRYVGKVCGQNKHILIIPCHRVIRANGDLGGFSATGGLILKKRLLNFEK